MKDRFSILNIIFESFWFYKRHYLTILCGAVIAAAAIVGGLFVGDSVKYTLEHWVLARLGKVEYALVSGNRFFSEDMAEKLRDVAKVDMAAVLHLSGIVKVTDEKHGDRYVNKVMIYGVDTNFWLFSNGRSIELADDEVAINTKLASLLNVKEGDEIVVKASKPALMPRDAPLASRKEKPVETSVFRVRAILDDDNFGRFSLNANQIIPCNVFLNRSVLQRMVNVIGKINLVITSGRKNIEELNRLMCRVWDPGYIGIKFREYETYGVIIFESDRVFIESVLSQALLDFKEYNIYPVGSLTYLVNKIELIKNGITNLVPYSFVVALEADPSGRLSVLQENLNDDEIILNSWTAEILNVTTADTIRLSYYIPGIGDSYKETSSYFRVKSIIPTEKLMIEKEFAPNFPGLTDVDKCAEWDIGLPLDGKLLRNSQNELYWKRYRNTPKAIISLRKGQELWKNRFGDLSAVRYPLHAGIKEKVLDTIKEKVSPEMLGMYFIPVKDQAIRAVNQAMDFGMLFVSMSFFLIMASLILTALLFVFMIQQRANEMGILSAIGFSARLIRLILLLEGGFIAIAGAILGTIIGLFYTRFLIWGLSTCWKGAIGGASIKFYFKISSILAGILLSFIASFFALIISIWKQIKLNPIELLRSDFTTDLLISMSGMDEWKRRILLVFIIINFVGAISLVFIAVILDLHTALTFFIAGSMLLMAGISSFRYLLDLMEKKKFYSINFFILSVRNIARRPLRSLATIGLLGCGSFMVFAVGSMREDLTAGADKSWSGTGGFALFAEATIPIPDNIDLPEARKRYKLDLPEMKDVKIICMRKHEGDDASCFNLNRAQSPSLISVIPEDFVKMSAFTRGHASNLWNLLNMKLPGNCIPGLVGDSDTAVWNLQKKIGVEKGDIIEYRNEYGEVIYVKLVGKLPMRLSVLQGNILISERDFVRMYPSSGGYKVFMIDCPLDKSDRILKLLSSRFSFVGMDIVKSVDRLKEFYTVEITYLNMFMVLGAIGLLIGSLGLGVVVMRNVFERGGELATLNALGYSKGNIKKLLLNEHILLMLAGLATGTFSSFIAVYPALKSSEGNSSSLPIIVSLAIIIVNGFMWTYIATGTSLRRNLIENLKKE